MEIKKEQALELIRQAYNLLEGAHHKYYKDTCADEEMEQDDALVDAIECLQEILEK